MPGGWVYIMTNKRDGTLYVGVTADLTRRVWQHGEGTGSRFALKYNLARLVHVERHDDIISAIQREKNIKGWPRSWKVALIERENPEWNDLGPMIAHIL